MNRGLRAMTGLAGLALSAAALAGCADDNSGDSGSGATDQATAASSEPKPVFPTGKSPGGSGGTGQGAGKACDLLTPDDIDQVSDVSGVSRESTNTGGCDYTVDGKTVLRLGTLTYPQAPDADGLLQTTLSTYDNPESVDGVGDAAAYVEDAASGPTVFAVVEDKPKATVITLSWDPKSEQADSPDAKDQLVELAGIAADNL